MLWLRGHAIPQGRWGEADKDVKQGEEGWRVRWGKQVGQGETHYGGASRTRRDTLYQTDRC